MSATAVVYNVSAVRMRSKSPPSSRYGTPPPHDFSSSAVVRRGEAPRKRKREIGTYSYMRRKNRARQRDCSDTFSKNEDLVRKHWKMQRVYKHTRTKKKGREKITPVAKAMLYSLFITHYELDFCAGGPAENGRNSAFARDTSAHFATRNGNFQHCERYHSTMPAVNSVSSRLGVIPVHLARFLVTNYSLFRNPTKTTHAPMPGVGSAGAVYQPTPIPYFISNNAFHGAGAVPGPAPPPRASLHPTSSRRGDKEAQSPL